ncbi:MAG: leucine-rich repeat domain-containing protein [Clostridia bacterium]|nr:leucine-rich repeat domain-containing protein [Clostridia bacterium]
MKKHFFTLALLSLFFAFAFSIANAEKSKAFSYKIQGNGTIIITSFNAKEYGAGDVYIPRMLDGYSVTGIDDEAFTNAKGVVVIPDTVISIGKKAFFGSGITAITIPASVEYIGYGAFSNCRNLNLLTVDSANKFFATIDGALYNKSAKELLMWPYNTNKIIIPKGIRCIGDYSCYGIGDLNYGIEITVPETLVKIGNYAFARTVWSEGNSYELYNNLPESLTYIGEGAFSGTIDLDFASNRTIRLSKNISYIGPHAFEAFSYMGVSSVIVKSIDLSNLSLEKIEDYVFYGYQVKESILLPKTLEEIGEYAFGQPEEQYEYPPLGNIEIPSSVKVLNDGAFAGWGMSSISIPKDSKLKTIGNKVFTDMSGKQITFYLPESLKSIGEGNFDRAVVILSVEPGSYAETWAKQNGYVIESGVEDTSWLDD